ncbi:metal-sulfur cluster assembly factor [Balneolaceae bacterium YR4-1]|uniref:Metal-sulfur cluster assembly factor n=1 Tax=Halalkalibaculum roseum TaxID=2709311 RepID=A0A6M1SVW4_9BACT|nr:metal-sulfur cluster assembly factor [Halalkalibaculum roseum]NGP75114.1 metal-sulfur cluster assembly factor [Halalkalibaculum roseum]
MNESTIDRREIARKLREVIDPELGVNIVDLGLVYNILYDDGRVIVEFTATTPGCPMRRFLRQQVEEKLASIDEIREYEALLVWEPEWNVDMIEEDVDFFANPPPQL